MFEPIYNVMHREGIIDERVFSLCLGKNGGYAQIGGYDGQGHIIANEDIIWVPLISQSKF